MSDHTILFLSFRNHPIKNRFPVGHFIWINYIPITTYLSIKPSEYIDAQFEITSTGAKAIKLPHKAAKRKR
jgi:hypothetical protein